MVFFDRIENGVICPKYTLKIEKNNKNQTFHRRVDDGCNAGKPVRNLGFAQSPSPKPYRKNPARPTARTYRAGDCRDFGGERSFE